MTMPPSVLGYLQRHPRVADVEEDEDTRRAREAEKQNVNLMGQPAAAPSQQPAIAVATWEQETPAQGVSRSPQMRNAADLQLPPEPTPAAVQEVGVRVNPDPVTSQQEILAAYQHAISPTPAAPRLSPQERQGVSYTPTQTIVSTPPAKVLSGFGDTPQGKAEALAAWQLLRPEERMALTRMQEEPGIPRTQDSTQRPAPAGNIRTATGAWRKPQTWQEMQTADQQQQPGGFAQQQRENDARLVVQGLMRGGVTTVTDTTSFVNTIDDYTRKLGKNGNQYRPIVAAAIWNAIPDTLKSEIDLQSRAEEAARRQVLTEVMGLMQRGTPSPFLQGKTPQEAQNEVERGVARSKAEGMTRGRVEGEEAALQVIGGVKTEREAREAGVKKQRAMEVDEQLQDFKNELKTREDISDLEREKLLAGKKRELAVIAAQTEETAAASTSQAKTERIGTERESLERRRKAVESELKGQYGDDWREEAEATRMDINVLQQAYDQAKETYKEAANPKGGTLRDDAAVNRARSLAQQSWTQLQTARKRYLEKYRGYDELKIAEDKAMQTWKPETPEQEKAYKAYMAKAAEVGQDGQILSDEAEDLSTLWGETGAPGRAPHLPGTPFVPETTTSATPEGERGVPVKNEREYELDQQLKKSRERGKGQSGIQRRQQYNTKRT